MPTLLDGTSVSDEDPRWQKEMATRGRHIDNARRLYRTQGPSGMDDYLTRVGQVEGRAQETRLRRLIQYRMDTASAEREFDKERRDGK